jgi:hypothetical protein
MQKQKRTDSKDMDNITCFKLPATMVKTFYQVYNPNYQTHFAVQEELRKWRDCLRGLRLHFQNVRYAGQLYRHVQRYTLFHLGSLGRYQVYRSCYKRSYLCYLSPFSRGDLTVLNQKYGLSVSIYQSGITWIFLKRILKHALCEITVCRRFEYKEPDDCFLTYDGCVKDALLNFGRICKIWLVVIKHHCVWWGPYARWFAFLPGSID